MTQSDIVGTHNPVIQHEELVMDLTYTEKCFEYDKLHDKELARQREKDAEHDKLIAEISMRMKSYVSVPVWLKVIVFLNLALSATAIGMILLK